MNRKYYIGQMLDVIKPCGFEVGLRLPITHIFPDDSIMIDNAAIMNVDIVDAHFKPVVYDASSMLISDKQNYIKSKLADARKLKKDIMNEISHLIKLCKHEDLDINDYGSAKCNICGKSFHWYCPTSPTLKCCYDFIDEDGEEDYNEDDCIYCHKPEERK